MKVNNVEVIVLFFIFVIREVTARYTDISNILDHLNIDARNSKPLIVVVDGKGPPQLIKDMSDLDDLFIFGDDNNPDDSNENEDVVANQAKYLLYNYLLRTNPEPQDTEEEMDELKKTALRSALRARCQARVECEKKCDREERETYCPVNCKAVFDSLNLCEPPKKKNKCKKDRDDCGGKRGRTLPPGWRL